MLFQNATGEVIRSTHELKSGTAIIHWTCCSGLLPPAPGTPQFHHVDTPMQSGKAIPVVSGGGTGAPTLKQNKPEGETERQSIMQTCLPARTGRPRQKQINHEMVWVWALTHCLADWLTCLRRGLKSFSGSIGNTSKVSGGGSLRGPPPLQGCD